MSAAQHPEQPADDLMAIAEAAGVAVPTNIGPDVARLLTDDRLDAVLSTWARAYAEPDCAACEDTGMVDAVCWWNRRPIIIACTTCGGENR